MMFPLQSIAVTLLVSLLGVSSIAATPTTQPVDEAVAHLGDPDPVVRDEAVRTLRAAGAKARAALELAANGDDPEIAGRARELLRTALATQEIKPAAKETLQPEVAQYLATPREGRLDAINRLATTPEGLRALTKIWLLEPDPKFKAAVFDQLISEFATCASALLSDGNVATAELLLEAAVDRKSAGSPQAYAAYWLCRGKLDDAIRRWSARGGQSPPDTWAEQVLTALYRAKGDSKAALLHAQAADDADLSRVTQVWAGDWASLAARIRHDAAAPREPRELALLCGADAMAGDDKALDADVTRLIALVQNEEQAGAAGDILLLVNRPDDAVRMLTDAKQYYAAYEILDDRGKFDQAANLLAAHDAEQTQEALLLRASAAKEFARLGLKKQCTEMAGRLATENVVSKFARVYVSLAEAERTIGLADKSWEHFLAAIESAGESSPQGWYVARAFPPRGNDIDWPGVWNAALARQPARPVKELFDRVRSAYDGSMPLDALTDAISRVDFDKEFNHPYIELIWEISRKIRAGGRDADATKLIEGLAPTTLDGDLYIRLGDLAAAHGQWQKAATQYEAGWEKDRLKALPLYLQGWALEHAGQAAEGRERMMLAHMLPGGDEVRRSEFIRGLYERGLEVAAAREADVVILTGNPLSASSQEALRTAAALADDRGDFAVASALWQRVEADYLSGSYWFEAHALYMHLPNLIRDSRARALIRAGDIDGAQREIKTCLELLPIDSSIVIDTVPELDKAGKRSEADALFAKMVTTQETLCERFPDSPFQLNECAWLEAKCHRQLEKAIAHARRAVKLEMDPSYGVDAIDTLAEACFQRGDFDEAIAEEKRCVELAPVMPFHRKQLARFEAARQGK